MAIAMSDEPIRADIATRFQPGNTIGIGASPGRPVNYNEETLERLTYNLIEWIQEPDNLYLKNFCFEYGLEPVKIEEYSKRCPAFRKAWLMAKDKQEGKLVDLGLKRKISDSMAKFVLVNVHKWKEKTELSGDSANPLALLLDKIAKQNQEPIEIQALEAEQLTNQAAESIQPIEPKQDN